MDALNSIAIAMAAIAFTWVGYFLGIFFPAFGKSKRYQMERKAAGEKLFDLKGIWERLSKIRVKVDLSFIKRAWKKAADWLLEREDQEQVNEPVSEDEAAPLAGTAAVEHLPEAQPEEPADQPPAAGPPQVYIPAALEIPEDSVVLWHDRKKKKLFAKVEKDVVDLDNDLSKHQHGALSMLLVDLQDRVGLSATLKAAISEGTDQAYAEKEKKDKQAITPMEEPLKTPSFNPLRSFLDYVRADVPKLEEKPDSIPTQINTILQELLENTPLKDKGISVGDWPNRGVVFIVGIDVYDSIDQIPDESIQQVIRLAVKKWEETQVEED
jgi:hypothetical protein